MKKTGETLGYIRGMLKNADLGNENLTEILNLMLNAMDEHDSGLQKLTQQLDELDEYVESIDDDLCEMEDLLDDINDGMLDDDDVEYDDADHPLHLVKQEHECKCGHHHKGEHCHCHDDEDDDCDCEDEDDEDLSLDGFDNLFLGAMCPECDRLFCVEDADFDDPEALYRCPYCGKDVHIVPIDPKNIPLAERVDR